MAIQESEDMHQRGLTGTRWPHDGDEFAFVDGEINIEKHGRLDVVIEVRLGEIPCFDQWRIVVSRHVISQERLQFPLLSVR